MPGPDCAEDPRVYVKCARGSSQSTLSGTRQRQSGQQQLGTAAYILCGAYICVACATCAAHGAICARAGERDPVAVPRRCSLSIAVSPYIPPIVRGVEYS